MELEIDSRETPQASGICITAVILDGVRVTASLAENLTIFKEISTTATKAFSIETIKTQPIIRAYRDFYWQVLGIDPTKTRPSSEALARRILAGKPLPRINSFVDAYNAASIATFISLGAYDFTAVRSPLSLRVACSGETFRPIGANKDITLRGAELVLTTREGHIINQYPHRDAHFSRVTPRTKQVLLLAFGVPRVNTPILEKSIIRTIEFTDRVQGTPCQLLFQQNFIFE